MIDLDEYDKLYVDDYFCRSDLNKLVERLRQAEKDAARHRWLKEHGRHDYDVDDFFGGGRDRIDEKVDKAMQCQQ
ncbi:MAG: hypothetical protein ACRCXB_31350 [Aeromonadaceae bacterium]